MGTMADEAPPHAVRAAFGAHGDPVRLTGGKGGTWRVGDVVLKPAEGDAEVRWRSGVLARLPQSPHFRIARPVRAAGGDWVAGGWEATRAVAGQPDPHRVDDVIRTGAAFHEAVAAVPRPGLLDHRDNPWEYGNKLAFADGLPPAVIDWAAYWRPAAWASAVAAVDAMVWHGAGGGVIERWAHLPEWGQLLVRAAIYRLGTGHTAGSPQEPEDPYRPVVAMIASLVTGQKRSSQPT
jgi:hypothetical protein